MVKTVPGEEGDGHGGHAEGGGGVVQDGDGRGGGAPRGCGGESCDVREARELLQAGAADYGDWDSVWE